MSTARATDQADFDLERFINMFDEAMTSQDPRVTDALRSLMMMVILTRPDVREGHGRNSGPLRRLFEDVHHLNRRMYDLEDAVRRETPPQEERAYQEEALKQKIAMQSIAQHVDPDLINTLKIRAKGLYQK
jgi:hypothetical protein